MPHSNSDLPVSCLVMTLATITAITNLVAGQEDQDQQKPGASVSLIPVGPRSATVWEGDGNSRHPVAVDPKALPPRFLKIRTGKDYVQLATTLNRPTGPVRVIAGELAIHAHAPDGSESALKPLTKVEIPEGTAHYDIFLTRAKDEDGWEGCSSYLLRSSPDAFPKGNVRLVNISDFKTATLVNGKRFDIDAGKHVLAPIKTDKLTIKCAYQDEEKWHLVMDTVIGHESDARITVVIYPNRSPSMPCEATFFRQVNAKF